MAATEDARGRIQAVAEEEFALRGFAGARVEEIARKADVNKALIYYYFKSKDKLLRAIISDFVGELIELNNTLTAAGCCFAEGADRRRAFSTIIAFFRERKPVIRILLTEMVKGEAETGAIILLLEPLTNLFAKRLEERGLNIGPRDAPFIIHTTFYGLIPVLMFIILEDNMAQYLETDTDSAVARFDEVAAMVMENFQHHLLSQAKRS